VTEQEERIIIPGERLSCCGVSGGDSPRFNASPPQTPSALVSGVPARASADDQNSPPCESLRRRLEPPLIVEHPPQHLRLRRHGLTHQAHPTHFLSKVDLKASLFAQRSPVRRILE
jgi:hypothetical protein